MSLHAVSWALRQKNIPPVAKFVLVALCERADGDTGQCWPGLEAVAKAVSLSRRSVHSYIGALVRNGYVMKQAMRGKDGKHRSNHYWILFDHSDAPWIRSGKEQSSTNDEVDIIEPNEDEPDAEFARGSSSVDNPDDRVQPASHGPRATACTPQESLAEPSILEPSTVEQVEGAPPDFDPVKRRAEQDRIKAADDLRKPKVIFVFAESDAYRSWKAFKERERGREWGLVTSAVIEGKSRRGWWFPTLYPPRSTGPPGGKSLSSESDFDARAKGNPYG